MDIYDLVYLKYERSTFDTVSDRSIGQFVEKDSTNFRFRFLNKDNLEFTYVSVNKTFKGMLNSIRPLEEVILYNKINPNLKMSYRKYLYSPITEIDKDSNIITIESNSYRTGLHFNNICNLYTNGELINPPQSKKEDGYRTTPDGFQTKDENWKPGKWLI